MLIQEEDRGGKRSSDVPIDNLVDSDDDGPIISKRGNIQ